MVLRFNKVYIVESLKEVDLKTGKRLYENLLFFNNEIIELFELHQIKNREGLMMLFNIIKSDVEKYNIIPIIHFEMHGDENGLQLSSDEIISWMDIAFNLQSINIILKNRLIIVLALCYGIHFLSVFAIYINSRSPFAGVISTENESKSGEILNGFTKFYQTLIMSSGDADESLSQLNSQIQDKDQEYLFLSCRSLFIDAFKEYLALCTAKNRNLRTERLITKIRNNNPNADINSIRKELKRFLHKNNQKQFFLKQRNRFLMYDLDEENKNIFWVDYISMKGND